MWWMTNRSVHLESAGMRFEVLTLVLLKALVCQDVKLCCSVCWVIQAITSSSWRVTESVVSTNHAAWPWRRRNCIPLKHQYLLVQWHSVTLQKVVMFIAVCLGMLDTLKMKSVGCLKNWELLIDWLSVRSQKNCIFSNVTMRTLKHLRWTHDVSLCSFMFFCVWS